MTRERPEAERPWPIEDLVLFGALAVMALGVGLITFAITSAIIAAVGAALLVLGFLAAFIVVLSAR